MTADRSNLRQVMVAAHAYARARLDADYSLGTLDADTFRNVTSTCTRRYERLQALIVGALPLTLATSQAFELISEFAFQLENYVGNRRAGLSADCAGDLRAAAAALLAAGR